MFELKKTVIDREAIGQALEYAAWINTLSEEKVKKLYQEDSDSSKDLISDLSSFFNTENISIDPNPRIFLVAPKYDESTLLTADFWRNHNIDINIITFNFFKKNQDIFLESKLVFGPSKDQIIRRIKITKYKAFLNSVVEKN